MSVYQNPYNYSLMTPVNESRKQMTALDQGQRKMLAQKFIRIERGIPIRISDGKPSLDINSDTNIQHMLNNFNHPKIQNENPVNLP